MTSYHTSNEIKMLKPFYFVHLIDLVSILFFIPSLILTTFFSIPGIFSYGNYIRLYKINPFSYMFVKNNYLLFKTLLQCKYPLKCL